MNSQSIPMTDTRTRAADFLTLTKPRLNLLVIATAAAGYYLGTHGSFDAVRFVNTVLGTALVAGGSAAFNQIWERRADAMMERTKLRPIADGRLTVREATIFAAALSAIGCLWLALGSNLLATSVAVVTLLTYVILYTPLKMKTSFSTVVGAVPGALPPMIGWAAATDVLSREAWVLFGIVFFWQMPHFLAVAWLCREDYGRAGFPMLPVVEPDGRSTAYQVMAYSATLVPVSLAPAMIGLAGLPYFAAALVLGVAFLWYAWRFASRRGRAEARALFLASITYLPLVFLALVLDAR